LGLGDQAEMCYTASKRIRTRLIPTQSVDSPHAMSVMIARIHWIQSDTIPIRPRACVSLDGDHKAEARVSQMHARGVRSMAYHIEFG
jgi:hypothetical protein